MRQIVLDTETTGLETSQGHRIIEIGCVEVVNRKITGNHYHQYINPERKIDEGAMEVHGITDEYVADKPTFSQIIGDFLEFLGEAELVIHNAPFDIGFINYELSLCGKKYGKVEDRCTYVDSLAMARARHPGQKNNLDALCKRYAVDNSQRELHGALLDAEILADVFLLMTGGQTNLALAGNAANGMDGIAMDTEVRRIEPGAAMTVIKANEEELSAHQALLEKIKQGSDGECLWLQEVRQEGL